MGLEIVVVHTGPELEQVRALLREYAALVARRAPGCFEDFEEEEKALPGAYGPPRGVLLLARVGGKPAGCVALRPRGQEVAEMRRLFVRPAFRGQGVGRALVETLLERARTLGYRRMVLETLPFMEAARALYRRLGFREVGQKQVCPDSPEIVMERELEGSAFREPPEAPSSG